jgi:hypothetical protein
VQEQVLPLQLVQELVLVQEPLLVQVLPLVLMGLILVYPL